ncbi:MAG: hypothetical protein P8N02_20455 [Actinomycetota bacterium]|jgi:hypothetical protein|nr:hypothetical protein [Actinomycetota bacterium]
MKRRAASILVVLAAFAFGCSSADGLGDAVVDSGVTGVSTAPSSAPLDNDGSFTPAEGRAPRSFLDSVDWPDHLVVVPLSGEANEQLLRRVTGESRLAPFVIDVAAVGLGEGRASAASVLAVQLATEAASDPAFRLGASQVLTGVGDTGDADSFAALGIVGSWFGSTLVIVTSDSHDTLAELMAAVAAAAS